MAGTEPFGIPRRDLAKHPAAEWLAKNLNHQIQMPAHHPHPLGKRGFGKQLPLISDDGIDLPLLAKRGEGRGEESVFPIAPDPVPLPARSSRGEGDAIKVVE